MQISLSRKFVTQPGGTPANRRLSITVISPQDDRREAALRILAQCSAGEVKSLSSYPPRLGDLQELIGVPCDVVIIDLDARPIYALELVEDVCTKLGVTVMVYSSNADPDLIVQSMRAGAREFITFPFAPDALASALDRMASRRPRGNASAPKPLGRLLSFLGAKGGVGTTMLACNFAVALAKESGESTLLIDLDLPLGDVALNLGLVAEYSTLDAFQAAERLDASFLSKLVLKPGCGISVLAAPGHFLPSNPTPEAIDKLLSVAQQEFENVVVDLGSSSVFGDTSVFSEGSLVYLVTQAGITELRNSNRIIKHLSQGPGPNLEVVLNRYEPRNRGVTEEQIAKALTVPVRWQIPNDYATVQRMLIDAAPLSLADSPIARQIRKMARAASGQTPVAEKKKHFALFR